MLRARGYRDLRFREELLRDDGKADPALDAVLHELGHLGPRSLLLGRRVLLDVGEGRHLWRLALHLLERWRSPRRDLIRSIKELSSFLKII